MSETESGDSSGSQCPWITGACSASEASVQHLWTEQRPTCYRISAVYFSTEAPGLPYSLSPRSARFMRKTPLSFSHLPLVPERAPRLVWGWSATWDILWPGHCSACLLKHCQSHTIPESSEAIGQPQNTQAVYYTFPLCSNQTLSSYLNAGAGSLHSLLRAWNSRRIRLI